MVTEQAVAASFLLSRPILLLTGHVAPGAASLVYPRSIRFDSEGAETRGSAQTEYR